MRTYLFFFIIFLSISCAKNPEEQASEAIDRALTHLSSGECDEAIEVLEEADDQDDNPIYLQVLASAYACKADYEEIAVISDDLSGLDTSTPASIMSSLTTMTHSPETAADSADYVNLKRAINILLNSTSGSPGHEARVSKFGQRKAGDMSVQALLLNVVNLGKFLNYYGNVNASGVKGGGSNTNACFLNYTDARAQGIATGPTAGACNAINDGHPDLDQSTDDGKRRLCEGLMLITNTLDILDNLDLGGSDELSVLEDVSTQVNTFKTAAVAAGLSTLINMTSQSACVTALNTPATLDDMEYLYALVFETGLQ